MPASRTAASTNNGDNGDETTSITSHNGTTTITTADNKDGTSASTMTLAPGEELPRFDHQGWHGSHTFLVIVGMILAAGLLRTWIRARHGDTRSNRQRRRDERTGRPLSDLGVTRENELLVAENEALKAQATRLEERVAVLERIVTDPARRVSDEIDALR